MEWGVNIPVLVDMISDEIVLSEDRFLILKSDLSEGVLCR